MYCTVGLIEKIMGRKKKASGAGVASGSSTQPEGTQSSASTSASEKNEKDQSEQVGSVLSAPSGHRERYELLKDAGISREVYNRFSSFPWNKIISRGIYRPIVRETTSYPKSTDELARFWSLLRVADRKRFMHEFKRLSFHRQQYIGDRIVWERISSVFESSVLISLGRGVRTLCRGYNDFYDKWSVRTRRRVEAYYNLAFRRNRDLGGSIIHDNEFCWERMLAEPVDPLVREVQPIETISSARMTRIPPASGRDMSIEEMDAAFGAKRGMPLPMNCIVTAEHIWNPDECPDLGLEWTDSRSVLHLLFRQLTDTNMRRWSANNEADSTKKGSDLHPSAENLDDPNMVSSRPLVNYLAAFEAVAFFLEMAITMKNSLFERIASVKPETDGFVRMGAAESDFLKSLKHTDMVQYMESFFAEVDSVSQCGAEASMKAKDHGNILYQNKEYVGALEYYDLALYFDPMNSVVLLNRSAASLSIAKATAAMYDLYLFQYMYTPSNGVPNDEYRRRISKSYYRLAKAYVALQKPRRAAWALRLSLQYQMGKRNAALLKAADLEEHSGSNEDTAIDIINAHMRCLIHHLKMNDTDGWVPTTSLVDNSLPLHGDRLVPRGPAMILGDKALQYEHLTVIEHQFNIAQFGISDIRSCLKTVHAARMRILAKLPHQKGIAERLDTPVAMNMQLCDSSMEIIARSIVLLVLASHVSGAVNEAERLELTILWISVFTNAFLSRQQRRRLDDVLDTLIQHSRSSRAFKIMIPWMGVRGTTEIAEYVYNQLEVAIDAPEELPIDMEADAKEHRVAVKRVEDRYRHEILQDGVERRHDSAPTIMDPPIYSDYPSDSDSEENALRRSNIVSGRTVGTGVRKTDYRKELESLRVTLTDLRRIWTSWRCHRRHSAEECKKFGRRLVKWNLQRLGASDPEMSEAFESEQQFWAEKGYLHVPSSITEQLEGSDALSGYGFESTSGKSKSPKAKRTTSASLEDSELYSNPLMTDPISLELLHGGDGPFAAYPELLAAAKGGKGSDEKTAADKTFYEGLVHQLVPMLMSFGRSVCYQDVLDLHVDIHPGNINAVELDLRGYGEQFRAISVCDVYSINNLGHLPLLVSFLPLLVGESACLELVLEDARSNLTMDANGTPANDEECHYLTGVTGDAFTDFELQQLFGCTVERFRLKYDKHRTYVRWNHLTSKQLKVSNKCFNPGCQHSTTEYSLREMRFRVCGRCKRAKYCSRRCQLKHWNKAHQHDCAAFALEYPLNFSTPYRFQYQFRRLLNIICDRRPLSQPLTLPEGPSPDGLEYTLRHMSRSVGTRTFFDLLIHVRDSPFGMMLEGFLNGLFSYETNKWINHHVVSIMTQLTWNHNSLFGLYTDDMEILRYTPTVLRGVRPGRCVPVSYSFPITPIVTRKDCSGSANEHDDESRNYGSYTFLRAKKTSEKSKLQSLDSSAPSEDSDSEVEEFRLRLRGCRPIAVMMPYRIAEKARDLAGDDLYRLFSELPLEHLQFIDMLEVDADMMCFSTIFPVSFVEMQGIGTRIQGREPNGPLYAKINDEDEGLEDDDTEPSITSTKPFYKTPVLINTNADARSNQVLSLPGYAAANPPVNWITKPLGHVFSTDYANPLGSYAYMHASNEEKMQRQGHEKSFAEMVESDQLFIALMDLQSYSFISEFEPIVNALKHWS